MRESTFSYIALLLFTVIGVAGYVAAGNIKGMSFDPLGPSAAPYGVCAMIVLLSGFCAYTSFKKPDLDAVDTSASETTNGDTDKAYSAQDVGEVLVMLILVIAYVIALFSYRVPFSIATTVLIPLVACLLERAIIARIVMIAIATGLFIGVGGEWLFTKVFFIDLPSIW